MVERISTGIKGLDDLIEGGLPAGRIVLVAGPPGTGKSILCSQIAFNVALKGKKSVYLNFEQNQGRLDSQMSQFDWKLEKTKGNLELLEIDTNNSGEVDKVLNKLEKTKYDLVVLDSLDSALNDPVKVQEFIKMGARSASEAILPALLGQNAVSRARLKSIFRTLVKSGAAALVISEKVEGSAGISRDTISEFICDGIFLLDSAAIGKRLNRTIEIKKMRETNIQGGKYDLQFGKNGIEINK